MDNKKEFLSLYWTLLGLQLCRDEEGFSALGKTNRTILCYKTPTRYIFLHTACLDCRLNYRACTRYSKWFEFRRYIPSWEHGPASSYFAASATAPLLLGSFEVPQAKGDGPIVYGLKLALGWINKYGTTVWSRADHVTVGTADKVVTGKWIFLSTESTDKIHSWVNQATRQPCCCSNNRWYRLLTGPSISTYICDRLTNTIRFCKLHGTWQISIRSRINPMWRHRLLNKSDETLVTANVPITTTNIKRCVVIGELVSYVSSRFFRGFFYIPQYT